MIGDYTEEERDAEIRSYFDAGLGFCVMSPSLFLSPPGVNAYNAYARVFSALFATWIVGAALAAMFS